MAVTIENRLRRMQVLNLVHDAYCRGRKCSCSEIVVVVTDENRRTGERARRRVSRQVPAVLTLLAREMRSDLPATILEVPDVRAAVDRGHLRVVAQEVDAPSLATPPTGARTARARKEE